MSVLLEATPYINPDTEEDRQNRKRKLESHLRINTVQFGCFYYADSSRKFSIEWEHDCVPADSYADLAFEYDHRLIRVTVSRVLFIANGLKLK